MIMQKKKKKEKIHYFLKIKLVWDTTFGSVLRNLETYYPELFGFTKKKKNSINNIINA